MTSPEMKSTFFDGKLSLTPIGLESESLLQEVYFASPTYFRRVDGTEPLPGMALKDIQDVPPKRSPEYLKVPAIIFEDSRAIGFVDLHVHHRTLGCAYLGLLLLREDVRRQGYGRKAYLLVEKYLRQEFGIKKIYLGVSDRNKVNGYWEKMGFVPNGFTYEWKGEKVESTVVEMEKVII